MNGVKYTVVLAKTSFLIDDEAAAVVKAAVAERLSEVSVAKINDCGCASGHGTTIRLRIGEIRALIEHETVDADADVVDPFVLPPNVIPLSSRRPYASAGAVSG